MDYFYGMYMGSNESSEVYLNFSASICRSDIAYGRNFWSPYLSDLCGY